MAVRCRGRLTLYEARGKFQMSVVDVEPTGAGALALAFEQLKQRLGAEGLFDPARKRPLPFLPRRLGVVTSAPGRRHPRHRARRAPPLPRCPILLSPTPVQGDGAALAIAAALRRLEAVADVDVIIVARGGGSLEDLWAFNEEPVARAIVACRVPVISAVGHETDFTIADFVADVRAPTPSAAAERWPCRCSTTSRPSWRCCARAAGARWPSARAARATSWSGRARASAIRAGCSTNGASASTTRSSAGRRVLARRLAAAHAELRTAETRLYRAHPHRRIREQRGAAGGDAPPAGGGSARRRWPAAATRSRPRAASWRRCRRSRVLERGFSLTQRADGHLDHQRRRRAARRTPPRPPARRYRRRDGRTASIPRADK